MKPASASFLVSSFPLKSTSSHHAIQWLISFLLLSLSHPLCKIPPWLWSSSEDQFSPLSLTFCSTGWPLVRFWASSKATNSMMVFWKSWKKHWILSTDYLTMRRRSRLQSLLYVKNWLTDVKHAVYEADDILEEIDYEYLRSKDIDAPRPDSNWVSISSCTYRPCFLIKCLFVFLFCFF